MSAIQQLTWIIIRISLTFKAHSSSVTLSRNMSGSGLYLSRSGSLSWTRDKDNVAKVIFAANITNAAKKQKKKQWRKLINRY